MARNRYKECFCEIPGRPGPDFVAPADDDGCAHGHRGPGTLYGVEPDFVITRMAKLGIEAAENTTLGHW